MMKPNLKVTIAYGSVRTEKVAVALAKELGALKKKNGYPVLPQLVYNNDNGIGIHGNVHQYFSDFDIAVFIVDVKYIAKPIGNEAVEIPLLSPNLYYEMSLALQTNESGIIWCSLCSVDTLRQQQQALSDYAGLMDNMLELPDLTRSDDEIVCRILEKLHSKIKEKLQSVGYDFVAENYSGEIKNVLTDGRYRARLRNIASAQTVKLPTLKTLASYASPLGDYIYEEYSSFTNANELELSRRIQYLVDIAVFFVYIKDRTFLTKAINDLIADGAVLQSGGNVGAAFYTGAIDVLRQVALYHGRMGDAKVNFTNIRTELLGDVNNILNANPMLKCLAYDYLGLATHKIAIEEICKILDMPRFFAENPKHIDKLIESYAQSSERFAKILTLLKEALNHFDKVIDSADVDMETNYIWRGYARYNRARCEFLLFNFGDNFGDNWRQSLQDSVDERKSYYQLYEPLTDDKKFPAVISYNLHAEYFHAMLELLLYRKHQGENIEEEYERIQKEIQAWTASSAFYGDTIEVTQKLGRLSALM